MSFVLTAAVKGHQEDYGIAFNQYLVRMVETYSNWSAIVLCRSQSKE